MYRLFTFPFRSGDNWRKKYYKSKRTVKRLQKQLRKAKSVNDKQSLYLSSLNIFSEAQLNRLHNPKSKSYWDQAGVAKALALKSISSTSYKFVTTVLKHPLPSPSCLSRWVKNFQTPPGMLRQSLDMLHAKGLLNDEKERLTILSFDEMSIKAQYSYSASSDRIYSPSNNVQVIMARGLISNWKQPIFYNFDMNLTKGHLLDIILELHKINYTVVALVCDQGGKNQALYSAMQLTEKDSCFTHPEIFGR